VAVVRAKKYVLLFVLLLTVGLGVSAGPPDSRPPLSEVEVLDLLTSSTPRKVIVSTIQQYGIAFTPSPRVLEKFRKAGADTVVLAALKEAWHGETPKPLGDKEILIMLAENTSGYR
jgi:hypothetical protein